MFEGCGIKNSPATISWREWCDLINTSNFNSSKCKINEFEPMFIENHFLFEKMQLYLRLNINKHINEYYIIHLDF